MPNAVVQLGRLGDILNILPVLEENNRNNRRLSLVISQEFKAAVGGFSYADVHALQLPPTDVPGAVAYCRSRGLNPFVAQLFGTNVSQPREMESFTREQWNKLGRSNRWEQISLTFDRRDPVAEQALVDRFDWSKPVVLVNLAGKSSPFSFPLLPELSQRLTDFTLIDLSTLVVSRIDHLLGLFDRAHALVTIDTMTLHLAKASAVPVVALVNPKPWFWSLRTANHLLTRRYNEVDPDEIADAVRRTVQKTGKIVHVWPEWEMHEEDRRRNVQARQSWEAEYAAGRWKSLPAEYGKAFSRTSQSVLGDTREVPFVRDVLEHGLNATSRPDDIVVVTNSDVGFTPGLDKVLRRSIGAFGAAFSYRFNFEKGALRVGSRPQVCGGYWDGGLDLFAFSNRWLRENFKRLPDMVMGCTDWDLVYRDIVKQEGGGDITGSIWHERHGSFWTQHRDNAGNQHNRAISKAFFQRNDSTRPYRRDWK